MQYFVGGGGAEQAEVMCRPGETGAEGELFTDYFVGSMQSANKLFTLHERRLKCVTANSSSSHVSSWCLQLNLYMCGIDHAVGCTIQLC